MITEDYVSFETAKLLKEKGFNEECSCFYSNIDYGTPGLEVDGQLYYKNSALNDEEYAAPTLQMAMKWLREVHKIGVFPSTYTTIKGSDITHTYGTAIVNLNTYELMTLDSMDRETYEEACETAIKYCLENLI